MEISHITFADNPLTRIVTLSQLAARESGCVPSLNFYDYETAKNGY
jgi:hypothetical protein